MTLTPTEQRIAIEREAIPQLEEYKAKIVELSDSIEMIKSSGASMVELRTEELFKQGAHPKIERHELQHPQTILERFEKFTNEGYTILHKGRFGMGMLFKVLAPGVTEDDVKADLRKRAEGEQAALLDQQEKQLASVRAEVTAYKKEILKQLSLIPSLEDVMKSVR